MIGLRFNMEDKKASGAKVHNVIAIVEQELKSIAQLDVCEYLINI
jgi:hypothetical protein